jgi:hypothetical protein
MKKIFLLLIIALCITHESIAQSFAINTDGSTANNSALLDVKSTTKGLLVPRMSKAERNLIASPATGLLIFQNAPDSIGFYYYDGSMWNWMAALNGNADTLAWKRSGNSGTNPSVNFIGTTDNQSINFRQDNKWIGKWNSSTRNYFIGGGSGEGNSIGVSNVSIGDSAGNASTASNFNVLIGTNTGITNIGSWTTMIGIDAGRTNQSNGSVFIGSAAGMRNITGAANTFVGDNAGRDNTTAGGNSFFGSFAGALNTGANNAAFGQIALAANTTGAGNAAFGTWAMNRNTTASANTAVGSSALYFNSTGANNTAAGFHALFNNTTGANNTASGFEALEGNTNGRYNMAAGFRALFENSTGNRNVAIGSHALYLQNNDSLNVAIGDSAGYATNTSENTFIGGWSGRNNSFGLSNTFIGAKSGYNNNSGPSNTFVGAKSGYNNSSGLGSTALGHVAMFNNNSSFWQVAIGDSALYSNTGSFHNSNIAIGAHAAAYNPGSSGSIFIGFRSGYTSDGGVGNIFMGSYSGEKSAGAYNIGIGQQALRYATGNDNVALGYGAMQTSISGSNNTAIGDGAMAQDTSGTQNTVIGSSALRFSRNTSANTVSGYQAMLNHKVGNNNTATGYNALFADTSGVQNVAVGYWAMRSYHGNNNTSLGTNSLDFVGSGNNNTAIGYDADVMKTNLSNATAIGAFSKIDTSNAMVLGSTSINVGIGITKPYQAKLTVSANNASSGSTLAIFGYGQTGISFQQNNPTIGYNQYRDISAANAPRYMGNGFAWINHMEPTTGNMYWNSMPSGLANAAGGAETLRMTLTNTGSLGLNTIPTGNGQLQFPNVLDNRKIVLWESINNGIDFFGFGINGATLRYQIPLGNVHRFFAGNSILYTIFDNGNATLAGTLTQLSDERLKQNIKPINSTLSDLKKLNAYTYYWKDESRDQDMQIGLLAQEVEKVFPQLVKKDEAGLLGVNYNGFAPLLIKGMQEQQRMIEDLKKQIDELRQLIKK